jgi:hypothetical protein
MSVHAGILRSAPMLPASAVVNQHAMPSAVPPADPAELAVALSHPSQLFEPTPADVANGLPPGDSGIQQIRRQLASPSLRVPISVVIELPAAQITPQVEEGLRQAVQRYCTDGIARAEQELRAVRRDGMQTLVLGVVLLAVFLLVSEEVLRTGAPKGVRDFFGNGLFLVAAWVGMWYPLDTLLYSGRPHRLERKHLRALRSANVLVRPR